MDKKVLNNFHQVQGNMAAAKGLRENVTFSHMHTHTVLSFGAILFCIIKVTRKVRSSGESVRCGSESGVGS